MIKILLYPGYLVEQCVKTWQIFRFYFDFWQKWLNYEFLMNYKNHQMVKIHNEKKCCEDHWEN